MVAAEAAVVDAAVAVVETAATVEVVVAADVTNCHPELVSGSIPRPREES